MKNTKNNLFVIIPLMITFFVMGFVDMVGISTNYIKLDFHLSDTVANLLPSMIFLWFLVFSIPTGILMNKIGRKKTVLLSLVVTLFAMITPLFGYNFPVMMISFSLLGISNTIMQVSLNPLISDVVSGKNLASSLTLGQFFKAIASFIAPILATWAAIKFGNWRYIYLIFAAISFISLLYLYFTNVNEKQKEYKSTSFIDCFKLLLNKNVLLLFIGILVHVGIDVGTNLTAPKLLMERIGMTLTDAGYACSVYFLFRTIGCFSGAFILSRISTYKFFITSVIILIIGVAGLFFAHSSFSIYLCVALLGIGNSNIFPMIFSRAMNLLPERNNEISALMIMGISGGAVFPFFMGLMSDALNSQTGAIIILTVCVFYLIFLSAKMKIR